MQIVDRETAAAIARLEGKPTIFQAVEDGDIDLVRDHLIADSSCVNHGDQYTYK